MPIYEYRCKFGHRFDLLQKVDEEVPGACPECGKSVSRVFTPVAIHFKGKGFYNTDYGKQSKRKPKKGEPAPSPKEKEQATGDSSKIPPPTQKKRPL